MSIFISETGRSFPNIDAGVNTKRLGNARLTTNTNHTPTIADQERTIKLPSMMRGPRVTSIFW